MQQEMTKGLFADLQHMSCILVSATQVYQYAVLGCMHDTSLGQALEGARLPQHVFIQLSRLTSVLKPQPSSSSTQRLPAAA